MSDISQSSSGSLQPSPPNVTPSILVETTQDFFAGRVIDPSRVKLTLNQENLEETKARLEKEKAETDARIAKEKAEYEARLKQEGLDKAFQRKKESFAGLIVLVILMFCITIQTNTKSSVSDKDWSKTVIAGIVGAVLGFVFVPRKTSS